jgi:imidazolonepropionase-like amidohydrolase
MIRRSTINAVSATALAVGLWISPIQANGQSDYPPPIPSRRPMSPSSTAPTSSTAPPKTEESDQSDDEFFAVRGAIVHTVSGPTLYGPTVLCNRGKIVAIGHEVVVPEEAEVLDADGFHLYPGLVSVSSSGIVGSEPPEDNTNVYSLSMSLGLAGGVTSVVTGNTVAKLTFGTLDGHVIKRSVFHSLRYSTQDPSGRRQLRASLDRVRRYLRDLDDHAVKKSTDPSAQEPDKKWLQRDYATALKLLKHEIIAVADANTAQELTDLADLAERYGIRIVVRGAREGWVVAPAMARAGLRAVITPRTRRDPDERTNHPNGSSIENARILYDHGVPFAVLPLSTRISTSGLAGRDLMHLPMEAAFAVRGKLPEEVAIRAITLDAARILGVDHRIGSIDVGKDADFVIVDGELLHYMTLVRWTVVNGRIAYDKQKDSLLEHIRPDGDLDAPAPSDYWPRSLGDPVAEEGGSVSKQEG